MFMQYVVKEYLGYNREFLRHSFSKQTGYNCGCLKIKNHKIKIVFMIKNVIKRLLNQKCRTLNNLFYEVVLSMTSQPK